MLDRSEDYPAHSTLTIEGQLACGQATVQVRGYAHPTEELDEVIRWPDHALIRSLGPMSHTVSVGSGRFVGFGEVFLVPAGVPLNYRGQGAAYRHVACRFEESACEALTRFTDDCDDHLLRTCLNIRVPRIEAAMLRLAEETLMPSFASEVMVESVARMLVVDLARYLRQGEQPIRVKGGLAPWQLRRIESYLRDSADPSVSIGRLADLCGISASHLMRAFKQTTGHTVHAFVESVRLEKARRLLSETALPIKAIAAALGFSTASSFSFAFRRATGGTPATYREQFRGAMAEFDAAPDMAGGRAAISARKSWGLREAL